MKPLSGQLSLFYRVFSVTEEAVAVVVAAAAAEVAPTVNRVVDIALRTVVRCRLDR